jgi:hypothetical protein
MTANHRIEKLRASALIEIHDQRQEIEEMAQRAAGCGEQVDEALLSDILRSQIYPCDRR